MFPTLMSPIRLNPLELPNRILMPAMHLNLTPTGEATPELIDFFVAAPTPSSARPQDAPAA